VKPQILSLCVLAAVVAIPLGVSIVLAQEQG